MMQSMKNKGVAYDKKPSWRSGSDIMEQVKIHSSSPWRWTQIVQLITCRYWRSPDRILHLQHNSGKNKSRETNERNSQKHVNVCVQCN